MDLSKLLFPNAKKIALFALFAIINFFLMVFSTTFSILGRLGTGLPIPFYYDTGIRCITTPCPAWEFSLPVLLTDIVIWYLIAAAVVFILDKKGARK